MQSLVCVRKTTKTHSDLGGREVIPLDGAVDGRGLDAGERHDGQENAEQETGGRAGGLGHGWKHMKRRLNTGYTRSVQRFRKHSVAYTDRVF